MLTRLRFIMTIASLYGITIGSVGILLLRPVAPISSQVAAAKSAPTSPTKMKYSTVSGKPIRLVIPASSIDIAVDEGFYNEQTGEWTLSKTHAQYAMMTTLANNMSGTTFIYGHGTKEVFGTIGKTHPAKNAEALLYTDNGHIFHYSFDSARDLTPNDTSVLLQNSGPATLVIQTCTGAFSEWRTQFTFSFKEIIQ